MVFMGGSGAGVSKTTNNSMARSSGGSVVLGFYGAKEAENSKYRTRKKA